jgi:hypothetical protein
MTTNKLALSLGVAGTLAAGGARQVHGTLTAARSFDHLDCRNRNYPATESVRLGIATRDVTDVSLVGPGKAHSEANIRQG